MPPPAGESRRARGPAKGPARKQTYEKPRGPIKQRPVTRLYDDDEDLDATVEFDDPAASRVDVDAQDDHTDDVDARDDHTDDKE
jgi:hypothetical protein